MTCREDKKPTRLRVDKEYGGGDACQGRVDSRRPQVGMGYPTIKERQRDARETETRSRPGQVGWSLIPKSGQSTDAVLTIVFHGTKKSFEGL